MTQEEIERTLKWYCRDCECNGRCERNCAFRSFFEEYLNGNDFALPPDNLFNRTHYRRFVQQMTHNLEESIYQHRVSINPKDQFQAGRIAGMELMLKFVKDEIKLLLSKDD